MRTANRYEIFRRMAYHPLDRIWRLPARILWTGASLLILSVIFVGWLGHGAYQAKSSLEQAKVSAEHSKESLLGGKPEDAIRWAEDAKFHANQARAATHSPPWNVLTPVPLLGSPFKAVQQISDVVVDLTDDVLLPTATIGDSISPDKLIDGTRLDLQLLRAKQPLIGELAAAASRLDAQAQAITKPAFVSIVAKARTQLQDQISILARLLGNTAIAAQVAPSMMGADGPRTYLMAFQNNAEARGTGGLLGGFGILRFNDGLPTVDMLAPNTKLDEATADVNLGADFNRVYGWANPLTDFRNSNLSSHFPYAAQIWKSMWEGQSDVRIDGVVAIDPIALSYVLGVTGPATLSDGEVINQDNVVELTESTAYARFPVIPLAPPGLSPVEAARYDNAAAAILRKRYLQEIASAVVKKMTEAVPAPRRLLDALGKAATERRIAVWSAFPADQKLLEETPLAHVIPDDAAPYAEVVINNLAGNKMDYYLRRKIEFAADGCNAQMRNSTITVELTNTASADKPLPEYVGGASGLRNDIPLEVSNGTMVTSVRVIATKGARLMSVTANGKRTSAITHVERGHPTFEVQVAIPLGKRADLSFQLSEPTSPGSPRVPVQPLVDNISPIVLVPSCS